MWRRSLSLLGCLLFAPVESAVPDTPTAQPELGRERALAARDEACRDIADRLGSVYPSDCENIPLQLAGGTSVHGRPLLVREYPPLEPRTPRGRVLLFGGIHGDELASVSIVFTWMRTLERYHSGLFHWRIVPTLNPDGLMPRKALRVNANGVDLNRNFPSPDWQREATAHWVSRAGANPRYFPGRAPLSEPESHWLAGEIERFKPDVIVSVHAPLEVLDFDGPPKPPEKIGPLSLHMLGTYPGSLGRWAGGHLGLPVVTIELPHAGIMPSQADQRQMWIDLVRWLKKRLPEPRLDSNASAAR